MKKRESTARRGRGRPRTFDREKALARAMEIFWDQGYEGASLDALLKAMGMSASSLYATFGDKERLFEAAVDNYLSGPGSYMGPILSAEGTAKDAFERLFRTAAKELTRTGQPKGCMISQTLTHCSPASKPVRAALAKRRAASLATLEARIQQGIRDGELPEATNATQLARFLMSVFQGMSVQARDGASRESLLAIGRIAMDKWPGFPGAKL